MITYSLTLDAVDGEQLVGTHDQGNGSYQVDLVELHGPAGGNPIVKVTGTAPALLSFLLTEYVAGNLNDALDLLRDKDGMLGITVVE